MTERIDHRERPGAMRVRLVGLAALLTLVTLAAPAARVFACTCVGMSAKAALIDSDVAFIGVVAGIVDPREGKPAVSSGDLLQYTFAIEETLKGPDAIQAEVASSRDGSSCGTDFVIAQRWRVYARADEPGGLTTGLCSGNELLAENAPFTPADSSPPPAALLLAIGAGVVLVGISALAFMRGSRTPPS